MKSYQKLNQINKPLKAILFTHAHFDHIGASHDIVDRFDVPVYMHEAEFDFLKDPVKNGQINLSNMDYQLLQVR